MLWDFIYNNKIKLGQLEYTDFFVDIMVAFGVACNGVSASSWRALVNNIIELYERDGIVSKLEWQQAYAYFDTNFNKMLNHYEIRVDNGAPKVTFDFDFAEGSLGFPFDDISQHEISDFFYGETSDFKTRDEYISFFLCQGFNFKKYLTSTHNINLSVTVNYDSLECIEVKSKKDSELLAGALVKRRTSSQKYKIDKIENGNVYFTDGWLRSVGNFLDYYEFLDQNNLDVFKSCLAKGIWRSNPPVDSQSSQTKFIPYIEDDSTDAEENEFYYEMESDAGPDVLSDYYDEYHSYD